MKTCYNCRHLYQCRLDYDRAYPCKDWNDSKNQKTKPSDSTKADEGEEDNTAGGCTAGEKL